MSSKISPSSPPSLPSLSSTSSSTPEVILSATDLKIKKLEAKLAALRGKAGIVCSESPSQGSHKRALVNPQEERIPKKRELMLSSENALLAAFPAMQKKLDPKNIVTIKVPQKNGKEEKFFIPAASLLWARILTQRFDHVMTDTKDNEIVLLRPDGSCYQILAINYVIGRMLNSDQCPLLKDRPKEEADRIFLDVWQFAGGYYPPLLEDCRSYLTERCSSDYDCFLSYGTTIFELGDSKIIQAWNTQLEHYFFQDKSKQPSMIRYLMKNLLGAYADDFEAYIKARKCVIQLLGTPNALIDKHFTSIDNLYVALKACLNLGDERLAADIFNVLTDNPSFYGTFPPDQSNRVHFCSHFYDIIMLSICEAEFEESLEALEELLPEEEEPLKVQDEKLHRNIERLKLKPLFALRRDVEYAKHLQDMIKQLLKIDPNDPWVLYFKIECELKEDLADERLKTLGELIDRTREQFPTTLYFKIAKLRHSIKTQKEEEVLSLLPEVLYFDHRKKQEPQLDEIQRCQIYCQLTFHFAEAYYKQGKIKDALELFKGIPSYLLTQKEAALLLQIKQSQPDYSPLSLCTTILNELSSSEAVGYEKLSLLKGKYFLSQGDFPRAMTVFSEFAVSWDDSYGMNAEYLLSQNEAHLWLMHCLIHQSKNAQMPISADQFNEWQSLKDVLNQKLSVLFIDEKNY